MQCVPCCSSLPQLQTVVIQVDAVCGAAQACHCCRNVLDLGLCCVLRCPCLAKLRGMLWLLWLPKAMLSDCRALA